MRPLDIRIALLRKGLTVAEVGRQLGYHRNLVQYAIRTNPHYQNTFIIHIQKHIANLLGKTPDEIWPAHKPKKRNNLRKAA